MNNITGEPERWRMIRHWLACRSGHRCEVCGRRLGPDDRFRLPADAEGTVHHRQPGGIGGTSNPDADSLERLLLCCGGRLGGVLGCHGRIHHEPSWAERSGYLVPRPLDPADVPVTLWSGRRVLLAATATEYLPAPGRPYAGISGW